MKKLSIILAILLMIGTFTACSSTGDGKFIHDSNETVISGDGKFLHDSNETTISGDYYSYKRNEEYYGGDTKDYSNEQYLKIKENKITDVLDESSLAFSLKVDTSSYSNIERYIENGVLPPADAVKIEEMLNYFSYEGEMPKMDDSPFSIYTEIGDSPFDENLKLGMIRVKTEDVVIEDLPRSNLTFLIDTSGSMSSYDKLPLLKEAFTLLVEELGEDDVVSIVTYAGSSEVVLDSVSCDENKKILKAIDKLDADGSTAGADGILTAYALAEKNYIPDGNNRIILASDGDFNVGVSSIDGLEALISEKRLAGINLSILGFGTGNLRDDVMETLAANGNGNYSYINSVKTAKKVLVEEMGANLFTVASDVKAQVRFNEQAVKSYRLIGYENRRMSSEEFENDSTDAGEIGVGTDVVMMFEMELKDGYNKGDTLLDVDIAYKEPGTLKSEHKIKSVYADSILEENTSDFYFASSVAAFGHLLRDSNYLGDITVKDIINLANKGIGKDELDYREDYINMVKSYRKIG